MEVRYSFAMFVRSRWLSIGLALLALVLMWFSAALLGVSDDGSWALVGLTALLLVIGLVAEYLRQRDFYRSLSEAYRMMEEPSQLSTWVSEPDFPDGRLVYQLLELMEAQSNAQVAEAQRRSQEYRDYIELWVHETKMPLSAAQLIAQRVAPPEGAEVTRQLDRLKAQIDQALYYARSTSLTNDYVIRTVPLAKVCREAVKRNARLLIECGVTPKVEVADDVQVQSDEPWLLFILGQLLTNAAQYGAKNIVISSKEVEPGTPRGHTRLEVRDDGQGIPAADVPRVFDRGFTGSNGRSRGNATGMGLYLISMMAERMGLGLQLASEEGAGTRILLDFPHA